MLQYLAYTVLGAGITAYTYYVTRSVNTKPAMYLFFLIGFALTVYGAYRLIRSLIFTASTKPTNNNRDNEDIIRCSNCGVKHYTTSNYCHKCGSKL
jgi:F0F1-type ATP synthase assembly protein I